MAPPVFGRAEQAARQRVVPLDRDRPLVEAAQRDPASFDALYRKYLAQVYSFAVYELRDHHAAEDATERVFLQALAALPRFREQAGPADGPEASTFRVWLLRIARNVVANEQRSRRRGRTTSLETALGAGLALVDPVDVAARSSERDEAAAAVRALDRLSPDRRRALVLRFVDELSTAEIAGVLGRSEGAVRVLIHRALRSIGRELGAARPAGPTVDTTPRGATPGSPAGQTSRPPVREALRPPADAGMGPPGRDAATGREIGATTWRGRGPTAWRGRGPGAR